ncbi:RrF2 family transcriptional regulator [Chloroflexota bacterium]
MKISRTSEYALKALVELAIDHDKGTTVALINDIAKRKGIPNKYLEQILLGLRNAGILVSKRGVGGGYSLSRSPENISLGEIIRAVEGSLSPVNCVSIGSHVNCPEESSCGLYSVMLDLRDAVSSVLDNTSLKDVARRNLYLIDQRNNVLSYAI